MGLEANFMWTGSIWEVNWADRNSVSSKCVNGRRGKEGTEYKILLKLYSVHFKIFLWTIKIYIFRQRGSKIIWEVWLPKSSKRFTMQGDFWGS